MRRATLAGMGMVAFVVVLLAAILGGPALGQDVPATGSDFGGVGLIESRNARFRPDGTLEAGASLRHQRRFWFLSFQALPFLETTFRLSERLNTTTGSGMTTDRAFDLKLRLIEEGQWTPAVAIGLQDVIGTGIYAGEYIAASRRWGPVDATLGLGWGRLATGADTNNPARYFSERFADRPRDVGRGGTLSTSFFRGEESGAFGGIEVSLPAVPTPWGALEGLRAKAEYSADVLRDESGGYPARTTGLTGRAASRFNFGLQWSNETVDAGLFAVHGTDLLIRLSFRIDPGAPPAMSLPPPPPMPARPVVAEADEALAGRVFAALRAAGLPPVAFGIEGNEAQIAVSGGPHRTLAQTSARVLRAVNGVLPPDIGMLRIAWWQAGAEVAEMTIPRAVLEAAAQDQASPEEAWAATRLLPAGTTQWPAGSRAPGGGFDWGVEPRLALVLGDPTSTLRYQGAVAVGGRYDLGAGVSVAGSVQQALLGNLSDGLPSDSALPHVRSDYARYAREGKTSIPALYAERIWTAAPDVFARVTVGLLEPMFGGISTEVLWRPAESAVAVGVDANYVRARDYDQRLAFRDYEVATGHVSVYADLPVWNLYGIARAGRYLAGDWGGTLELGRRFDSGIEIGGFATMTDVPFSKFGEGSFDKGIHVRLPLVLFGAETRQSGTALIRPVQRDGGQRLSVDTALWGVTRDGRADALRRGVAGFAR
ncbi:YjbH domain-containing protein [Humitalea rosea]|nr:YjbH domain-containing protein [Humitalea rosea]